MKKLLFALVCICTLTLASCGSKSPEQEAVGLLKNATEQLNKVETSEEFIKVLKDVNDKGAALDEKYPDLQDQLKDNEEAQKAAAEFSAALMSAAIKTNTDLSDLDF